MIQIIAGTVGVRKDGTTIPFTTADGAVDLGDLKREARLVKKGMAVYVNAGDLPPGGDNQPDDARASFDKEMKLPELQEIAKSYGVDASKMRTKDAVIDAIEAAIANTADGGDDTPEDDGGDYEQPPNIGTAAPEVTV